MLDLEWKATAVADLKAIVGYISDDNPDAAQALKDDIETRVSRLPENPRLYRVGRVDGTREMVVLPTTSSSMPRTLTESRYSGFCTRPSSGPRREEDKTADQILETLKSYLN